MVTNHRRFKAAWRSVQIGQELVKRGHTVTVLCIADHRVFRLVEYEDHGVHIVESPDLFAGRMRSGWDPYNTLRRIQYLHNQEYDLIHAYETRPATIYPILSYRKRHPVPLVIDWIDWWGRGGLIAEQRPWWYRFLFADMETWFEEHFRILANSSTVISRGLARRAENLGVDPESIFWIPHGCSPDGGADALPSSAECRERFEIPEDYFVVGFSALDVTLGVGMVFDAIRILRDGNPKVLMLMTGKNSPELTAMIQKTGIENAVRHLGYVAPEDYGKALGCVDVFAVPFIDRVANQGRWPGRINEYMARGKPIVTNPVGEMAILLNTHEIGLLAEETPEEFAAAIKVLMADPALRTRMGARARQLAETEFNWKTIVDRVEEAYEYALANRRGR